MYATTDELAGLVPAELGAVCRCVSSSRGAAPNPSHEPTIPRGRHGKGIAMKVITPVVLDLDEHDATIVPLNPSHLSRKESELVLAALLAAEATSPKASKETTSLSRLVGDRAARP